MLDSIRNWWRQWLESRRNAVMYERAVTVSFDDEGVSVTCPGKSPQSISWSSGACVAIETNDSGPWGADVWWVLEGASGRVAYPQGATGDREMFRQYPIRFPGFSEKAVIKAMGCTSNARFVCWPAGGTS